MKNRVRDISIEESMSLLAALKTMDKQHVKLLIVLSEGKYKSVVSIGDIQRAIIANSTLDSSISSILRPKISFATIHDSRDSVVKRMKERRNDFMPIVDDDNNLVDVIFWDEVFDKKRIKEPIPFDIPVVIMAGGQGVRLRPLTNVLPKPLIPIGEQTMIEDIMERFSEYGCSRFYISVNYKADFIRHYLEFFSKKQYNIEYFQEDKPLGTAGSLSLLKEKISTTFFVSNCDSIIEEDYSQILNFHRNNKNEITVVSAIKDYYIPYGTLETKENGLLKSLLEKPELTFKINTGMYILEPHLIDEIPGDRVYHITYLIEKLLRENRKVGVFPITDGSWIDIGNWDEYLNHFSK